MSCNAGDAMRERIAGFLVLVATIFGLSACSSGGMLPKLPATNVSGDYHLDTGDQVNITEFGEPRLNGAYTVNDKGDISMPLIGAVPARGQTVSGLEKAIADRLRGGLVLNPSVSVQIAEFRPFFILGEVASPGKYPYVEGMTVLTAVAIAGGFTFRAEKDRVSVTRIIDGKTGEYKAGRETIILPGDVINVYESYL